MISAQMKSRNAWAASQKAALNCFHAQLTADQSLLEAQKLRTFLVGGCLGGMVFGNMKWFQFQFLFLLARIGQYMLGIYGDIIGWQGLSP